MGTRPVIEDQGDRMKLRDTAPAEQRSMSVKMEDPRSDKRIYGIIVFVLTVVTVIVAAVVCCYQKQGMHEDEFYSYYSSNRTYGLIAEGTVHRDTVTDELIVREGEGFNFGLVREVQSWDVHPPVYYFVLHFVCSLMPGVFSMWQGLWINLACLLISLILMKLLGDILLNAAMEESGFERSIANETRCSVAVCAVILSWGLSAATLTGVVFIRMYMLLTVWILAVTLLHFLPQIRTDVISTGDTAEGSGRGPGDEICPWFWPVLGVLTFCGFMTHYYFFIWLFFLAVAWNIREIIRTRSVRTALLYGLTMIVSFGLCYLFYPAFPAQMFRGQRGAQATGNFLDMSNTWDRICFFAEKVNRIGFGGIFWILIGLAVVMCLLNADSRRGLRTKIARWSVNDIKDPGNYSPIKYEDANESVRKLMEVDHSYVSAPTHSSMLILVCALIGYFLTVSKTALMLGDSSIRYQMPVLGILYLCLAAGITIGTCGIARTLKRDADKGAKHGVIAACTVLLLLAVMNLVSALNGGISFLYPEKKEHVETLQAYSDSDVVYVYPDGQSWIAWADMTELLMFDEVTYITSGSFTTEYDADPHVLMDKYNSDSMILFADKGTIIRTGEDTEQLYSDEYCDVYAIQ